jgi:two-component system cell cycle sensor histidine kinase/response regulator CckA
MQTDQTQFQDLLVRGLTHRMNNILTLFHGYVGLLLDNDSLDKTTREGLTKIKDGAKAATELMDRTHSLVRPTAVVWREIELCELLRMMKAPLEALRSPGTNLELSCPDDLPPIWADSARLRTAITELARNAFDSVAPAGGTVKIEVTTEVPTSDGAGNAATQPIRWVCLSIRDDGPGIAPETEDKIFQPFFSTKKKQNAAGLGLNVASGAIQQLGGVLRHESAPGSTCFQILLPARSGA